MAEGVMLCNTLVKKSNENDPKPAWLEIAVPEEDAGKPRTVTT
jgi:hypothetical protein